MQLLSLAYIDIILSWHLMHSVEQAHACFLILGISYQDVIKEMRGKGMRW